MTAKASARKTKFGYKPVIIFPVGHAKKSEVIEQSNERMGVYTKDGFRKGNKYAQGNVYETRQEAIDAAQKEIEHRLNQQLEEREKFIKKHGKSNKFVDYNIKLYGGN